MRRLLLLCAVIAFAVVGLQAQWVNYPTPGIPRSADGQPDLAAQAPRTPDGRIDLTGVWVVPGLLGRVDVGTVPAPNRFDLNIASDIPDGPPLTPWAQAIADERRRTFSRDLPSARCLPAGLPQDMLRPLMPFKIAQTPTFTIILIEEFNNWRQIFTDGRPLPSDPQPSWFGYSIGRWQGDTFIVETSGFNDRTWLDGRGTPHSEMLRLTERFRRSDFGHLEIAYTFEDSQAFTRPWSVTVSFVLQDTELLENQCENEKDVDRINAAKKMEAGK